MSMVTLLVALSLLGAGVVHLSPTRYPTLSVESLYLPIGAGVVHLYRQGHPTLPTSRLKWGYQQRISGQHLKFTHNTIYKTYSMYPSHE